MNGPSRLLLQWKLVKQASVDARLSMGDVAVLINILDRLGDNGEAWPSLTKIAADVGRARRTITRSVTSLVDAGYLIRDSGDRVRSNRYRMGELRRDADAPTGRDVRVPTGRDADDTRVGTCVSLEVGTPASLELASMNLPIEPTQELAASAADAARPADPIWGAGLQFLIRKGVKADPARAFLGKLKKDVGDIAAAILLGQAEAQDITDPRAWLTKAASTRTAGNRVGAIPRDERDDHEIDTANREQLARFGMGVTA